MTSLKLDSEVIAELELISSDCESVGVEYSDSITGCSGCYGSCEGTCQSSCVGDCPSGCKGSCKCDYMR